MANVITINAVDADHLAHVMAQMEILGAPTIRAIRDEAHDVIVALEGSHRIEAAARLGLTPRIVLLDDDAVLSCEEIGFDDLGWFEGEPARAADIRDRIAGPGGTYNGCGKWHAIEMEG